MRREGGELGGPLGSGPIASIPSGSIRTQYGYSVRQSDIDALTSINKPLPHFSPQHVTVEVGGMPLSDGSDLHTVQDTYCIQIRYMLLCILLSGHACTKYVRYSTYNTYWEHLPSTVAFDIPGTLRRHQRHAERRKRVDVSEVRHSTLFLHGSRFALDRPGVGRTDRVRGLWLVTPSEAQAIHDFPSWTDAGMACEEGRQALKKPAQLPTRQARWEHTLRIEALSKEGHTVSDTA
ncbi:hypothetical protein B0T26DRAFT_449926 [Lasiosphaeria miniovina]|uniref:Uncharacterized protein n=1 Tax=Lasiosphaeria miniovina TaxID=1954250 RepID=A0AA40DM64_9PEZI|nr:uncharacterized protein B0T26DRAFT_449926 [Lasiosphaeria miniovina]KAK0706356.1 hypothetical protein B0T26DRAFT_449926 [Lasiosphaeria miniovina]